MLPYRQIGAGTANTEFEILTGMSLDYFGQASIRIKLFLGIAPAKAFATT
jgi:hypothetical protein